MLGCDEAGCYAEMHDVLAVQQMIAGTVSRTGDTSEAVTREFDGMLSRLFDARADGNPFHSIRRAHFFTSHPLKVDQQYEAWRSAQGLPPPRDPACTGHA